MLRVVGELLHPLPQLRHVDVQVLRRLHIRYASILDQAYSLKLELPRKLPSLHGPPPAPSKHLTRCLQNRVQATRGCMISKGDMIAPSHCSRKRSSSGRSFSTRVILMLPWRETILRW